ncbi:protein MEMO1 isoform X2 [Rattus norvegicus]|uniref:protein MEMO1 isoform X2 n=1 Tax=Rattus norvegicus TaxID=10116 RepID=UPI002FD87589
MLSGPDPVARRVRTRGLPRLCLHRVQAPAPGCGGGTDRRRLARGLRTPDGAGPVPLPPLSARHGGRRRGAGRGRRARGRREAWRWGRGGWGRARSHGGGVSGRLGRPRSAGPGAARGSSPVRAAAATPRPRGSSEAAVGLVFRRPAEFVVIVAAARPGCHLLLFLLLLLGRAGPLPAAASSWAGPAASRPLAEPPPPPPPHSSSCTIGGTGSKMSNRVVCREASHAGSWYTASGPQLNAQLEGWLSQVQSTKRPARAIIAPHAGYTYCGSCAAHAYKQVDPSITRRIFILGPSHHVPLSRCALSSVDIYRTPLYDLRIDQKIYGELWKTGMFERMSLQTDEDEHSIEMHLPYTAKAMERSKVPLQLL